MMEENVVSASGTSKISASERELQNTIIRAGFIPKRRDSDYQYLETQINDELTRELPSPIPLQ
jgi:2-iminoacetate synthase ThiH